MDFLLLIVLLCCVYAIGFRILHWSTRKDWAKYEMHKSCGHLSWYGTRPCPKCGESDYNWQVVHARAKLFGGWEWKVPKQND